MQQQKEVKTINKKSFTREIAWFLEKLWELEVQKVLGGTLISFRPARHESYKIPQF